MAVSGIVIGYQSRELLDTCLGALGRQSLSVDDVIFIDNCSGDGSVRFVREQYPDVRVIEHDSNLGYARAANEGIDASTGEYVLILNPDVILQEGYVAAAIKSLAADPSAAGVTGISYKYNFEGDQATDIIDSAGLIMMRNRRVIDRGAGKRDEGQYAVRTEVFGVSGHCPVFRRAALEDAKIGSEYFDEDFFMYKEDVDLCWRLRLFGWTFWYEPTAVVYHGRGTGVVDRKGILGSVKGRIQLSPFQRYHSYVNQRMMILKNELPATFLRDFAQISVSEIAALMWVLLREPETSKGILKILRNVPVVLRKRKEIMARKRVNANQIRPWIRGKAS